MRQRKWGSTISLGSSTAGPTIYLMDAAGVVHEIKIRIK
jgi:hypothetical protein